MRFVTPLLFIFLLQSQNISKPHVTPFFDRIDDGPAFFVDCLNISNDKVSSASSVWPLGTGTVRIDGSVIDFGNISGPGLSTEVEPGQSWRGIIVLRQSATQYFPAVKFGAMARTTLVHSLTPGKHTISVECEGFWSDDFVFFWEQEPS
jgi:hypothetical protein